MDLQRIRLRSGEFPSDEVEEPGGPIDSAPASVGALGGGRLPWPCQPLLHRPNGTVSHGSHALRHMLTALSLAPLRWAHLNSLAEQQIYVPDHRRYSRGGSFWVFQWQKDLVPESQAPWFHETLRTLDLLRHHAEGLMASEALPVDLDVMQSDGLLASRALLWASFADEDVSAIAESAGFTGAGEAGGTACSPTAAAVALLGPKGPGRALAAELMECPKSQATAWASFWWRVAFAARPRCDAAFVHRFLHRRGAVTTRSVARRQLGLCESQTLSSFLPDVEIHVLGAFAEVEDGCVFMETVMHVASRDGCFITQAGSNLRTVPESFSSSWRGSLANQEADVECSSASAFGTDVVVRCAFPAEDQRLLLRLETGDWKSPDIPFCDLKQEGQRHLTVCTGVMFNAGQRLAGSSLLQQWLTYHQAIGVDHFALYDSDGSAAPMLDQWRRGPWGTAQVSYFPFWPEKLSSKLASISRLAHCRHCLSVLAEAHCLWSQRGRSDWVITLHSFDAYLTPVPGQRLHPVLEHLEQKREEIGTVPLSMMDYGGQINPNSSWLIGRYLHRAMAPVRVLAEIGRGNPRDDCWLNHPGVTLKNPLNVWGVYDHYARSSPGALDVEVPWQLLRVNHYARGLALQVGQIDGRIGVLP